MPVTARLSVFALAVLLGCGTSDGDVPSDSQPVARVGSAVLTEADLAEALGDAPTGTDSVTARDHVIEQWVQRELLVQEARAQGLDREPAVQRRLAESERATLEAAALDAYFARTPVVPSDDDIAAYYETHRAALALREPYVRLRHLRVDGRQRAEEAQAALQQVLTSSYPDSLFALVAQEYADDPEGAAAFASEYVSEGRMRALDEVLGDRVASLQAGAQVAVVPVGSVFHVVQVVDRVPTGTVPPLALVRDELAERLAVQMRRDAEARLLQQLRSEAQARGRLDLAP